MPLTDDNGDNLVLPFAPIMSNGASLDKRQKERGPRIVGTDALLRQRPIIELTTYLATKLDYNWLPHDFCAKTTRNALCSWSYLHLKRSGTAPICIAICIPDLEMDTREWASFADKFPDSRLFHLGFVRRIPQPWGKWPSGSLAQWHGKSYSTTSESCPHTRFESKEELWWCTVSWQPRKWIKKHHYHFFYCV